jgi:hypothetical protein
MARRLLPAKREVEQFRCVEKDLEAFDSSSHWIVSIKVICFTRFFGLRRVLRKKTFTGLDQCMGLIRTIAGIVALVCVLSSCSSLIGGLDRGDVPDSDHRLGESERRIPLPPMVEDFQPPP